MPGIRDLVDDLNARIVRGDIMEAFELHYAEDVVMVDQGAPPRVGKDVNRDSVQAFVNGLTALNAAEVRAVGIDEEKGKAMVEWFMDYSHKDFGDAKQSQVAVQTWRDGKIVEERFYQL